MIKELIEISGFRTAGSANLYYIDLKTGVTMINYYWGSSYVNVEVAEPDDIIVGKTLNILEEYDFYDYLFALGEIRTVFDVNEIIDIYNKKVEPKIIEYINEEYSYTNGK